MERAAIVSSGTCQAGIKRLARRENDALADESDDLAEVRGLSNTGSAESSGFFALAWIFRARDAQDGNPHQFRPGMEPTKEVETGPASESKVRENKIRERELNSIGKLFFTGEIVLGLPQRPGVKDSANYSCPDQTASKKQNVVAVVFNAENQAHRT